MSTIIRIFVILNFIFMYHIYTLSCPTTNDVKYVGMTTNLKSRYFNHLHQFDGSPKSNWIVELLAEDKKPIMSIVDYAETKKQALSIESRLILQEINKGTNLLNQVYQRMYYKFDLQGNLVDILQGTRQENFSLKAHRYTCGGFVYNTENVFPSWKLEAKKKGMSVQKKKIMQFTKQGEYVATFDGVREAGKLTSIDHRSISANATNRRPSAGGYVWKYETK